MAMSSNSEISIFMRTLKCPDFLVFRNSCSYNIPDNIELGSMSCQLDFIECWSCCTLAFHCTFHLSETLFFLSVFTCCLWILNNVLMRDIYWRNILISLFSTLYLWLSVLMWRECPSFGWVELYLFLHINLFPQKHVLIFVKVYQS